uniref:BRCT domain-containing protein n=1 Tax=Wuchereria bancrofti TaxID=6293 RepID=A0AAF5PZJ0_WUCBA
MISRKMTEILSTKSNSSSFHIETPNFFESISNSSRFLPPEITDSTEHNLWMEAQLKAFEFSSPFQDNHIENVRKSKILEGVLAFVDVKLEKTSVLRQMLRDLGASVNSRFSKNITHLIFWNGRQETLDKAHHLGNKILLISPHWVFKCFMNQIRVDEAPFLLYGVKDLAVPMRLMAMGRMGTVNLNCHGRALNSFGSSPNQSQIVYAIEMLSDQLASKLTSPNDNIDVVEVISPIVDRVRKRLNELNCTCNIVGKTSLLKHSENSVSTEVCSMDIAKQPQTKGHCRVSSKQRRHTRSQVSMFHGESELQFTAPARANSTSTKSINLVEITQSEPVKRRGRPTVNSEQLAEYTPTRFHRYLQRRYRSVKAEHAAQLNTKKMVSMYRKMMNQNFSGILSGDRKLLAREISKARPVVVRTRSSVLNELQNIPSSNEFVKKKKIAKKRVKTGNIILSGISKIERETVFAITKKLGVLKIASTFDERTRYVVSDQEGMRTVNVMRALVKGIPIVTIEWAYRSLEIGGWLKGNDFFVPRWKSAHKAWLNGCMSRLFSTLGLFYVSSKCEPEARHLLHLIKCCHGKTTESLNRAVIFVAPQFEWRALKQLRKNTDTRATYITEKSLLDSICECNISFLL